MAQLIPGCARGFGECTAIGFVDAAGAFEAGVVFHNWNPETQVIEISAAALSRKWLTRDRMRLILSYPFDQLQCRLVVVRIGETNSAARRIWRGLGASEYAIPRLRSPSEAEMIYTLSPDQWQASRYFR